MTAAPLVPWLWYRGQIETSAQTVSGLWSLSLWQNSPLLPNATYSYPMGCGLRATPKAISPWHAFCREVKSIPRRNVGAAHEAVLESHRNLMASETADLVK